MLTLGLVTRAERCLPAAALPCALHHLSRQPKPVLLLLRVLLLHLDANLPLVRVHRIVLLDLHAAEARNADTRSPSSSTSIGDAQSVQPSLNLLLVPAPCIQLLLTPGYSDCRFDNCYPHTPLCYLSSFADREELNKTTFNNCQSLEAPHPIAQDISHVQHIKEEIMIYPPTPEDFVLSTPVHATLEPHYQWHQHHSSLTLPPGPLSITTFNLRTPLKPTSSCIGARMSVSSYATSGQTSDSTSAMSPQPSSASKTSVPMS